MATFDLGRFRELAFGRSALPDHPMRDTGEARKLLALLPDNDPDYGLAELTHWATTMNATGSFSPGRRARVLMLIDDAARPVWRRLGQGYLAPKGLPSEDREGDAAILRALSDSAAAFADGFGMVLDAGPSESRWVRENFPRLLVRYMRWLSRRLSLAYMLRLALTGAIWERLHRGYALAVEHDVLRNVLPAFEGVRHNTSVAREYVRALLLDLAGPDGMNARMIELSYRVAARVAGSVQLKAEPFAEANFAVLPAGDERPVPARLLKARLGAVYLDTSNCLPRLRAALERDMGRDPADEDVVFGRGFTVRERTALLERLLAHWGLDPPQRRSKRVHMAAPARLISGFEGILRVVPALAAGGSEGDAAAARRALHLKLDDTSSSLRRARLRAARVGPARVMDASPGGLGIAIQRKDAPWAEHGALVAVLIEPGKDWFIGAIRRIFAVENELRLGLQVLAAKPVAIALALARAKPDSTWEEAMRFEAAFREHYQSAILPEPTPLPLAPGTLLLAPGLASRGTQFAVQLPKGEQRIRITRLVEDQKSYQRVLFEPLELTRG